MNQTNRVAVTVAAMLGTALAALDMAVVGTAMPVVIGQLGGLSLYSWVFSIYLLTSTATVPVFGKLADMFGRKPTFLVGAGIFLLGSGLCGLAQSIEQLIVFRGIQGIGAGAVLPITLTIVGDIYDVEGRARIQGVFGAVWAVASIVGPAIGGFLTDYVSWRWVFYVNLPVGALACFMVWVYLAERIAPRRREIDYIGSFALVAGVSALLFALQQGGTAYPWTSAPIIGALVLFGGLLALFYWNERRAAEPMLPLSLFRNRTILVGCLTTAMAGAVLFGVSSYLPLYLQGVLGHSAFTAGMMLMPMSITWPLAAAVSGRLMLRYGYRFTALLGMGLVALGSAGLLPLRETTPDWHAIIASAVIGAGMGCGNTTLITSVQNAVGWSQRGVATGASQFFRTVGGAVGVALMGGLLAAGMGSVTPGAAEGTRAGRAAGGAANALLDPAARAALDPTTLAALTGALANAVQASFAVTMVAAVVGLGTAALFPGGRVRSAAAVAPAAASAGAAGREPEPAQSERAAS